MGQPIGIAILGVGRWGVHLLRNFLELPGANVVAVVDPQAAQLQGVRDRFSLDAAVHLGTDWETALALPGVDAVVVVTPAASHYALIAAALHQGKHVLAEKPLTLSAQDCAKLTALAAAQGRQLVVDHTYLFNPAVAQGQEAVATLGTLRYGYAARTNLGPVRRDVDALWDLAIHDIAIFNHWLQAIPDQVSAQGKIWLQPQGVAPHFPQGLGDVVWTRLHYANGVEVMIHVSWANPDKQRRLALVGDRGTLVLEDAPPPRLLHYPGSLDRNPAGAWLPTTAAPVELPVPPGEPLQRMCQHFLTSIETGVPSPLSGGAMATDLVRTLEALSQSLTAGGTPVALA